MSKSKIPNPSQKTYGIHCNFLIHHSKGEFYYIWCRESCLWNHNTHHYAGQMYSSFAWLYFIGRPLLLISLSFSPYRHKIWGIVWQAFISMSKHFTFIHLEIQILQSQTEANLKAIQPISNNPIPYYTLKFLGHLHKQRYQKRSLKVTNTFNAHVFRIPFSPIC